MHRLWLIPFLAFGTVAGFAHGFHSLHACAHAHDGAFERPAIAAVPPPPAAPAPAPQTLVIPIVVAGQPTQPTTYVVQVPTGATSAVPVAPAPPASR